MVSPDMNSEYMANPMIPEKYTFISHLIEAFYSAMQKNLMADKANIDNCLEYGRKLGTID